MRSLKVFGAWAALSSLAGFAAMSCATSEGQISFGKTDAGRDAPSGIDSTLPGMETGTHDTGVDTTVGFDSFVGPTPDTGGPDVAMGMGMDAGFDGGLLFFGNPGSSCTKAGAVQAQACGICGMQTSTCIVRPDGGVPFDAGVDAPVVVDAGAHVDATLDASGDATGDAAGDAAGDAGALDAGTADAAPKDGAAHDGATSDAGAITDASKDGPKDAVVDANTGLVWSEWGACTGQLSPDAGCLPGTQKTVTCGACGSQTFVCEPDCEYGATGCVGEIDGGCFPGTVAFTPSAACSDAGFGGTQQVCTSTCSWDASTACVTPPSALTVSTTPGAKLNTFVDLTGLNEKPLVDMSFSCPSTLETTTLTPYAFVTLTNPNATQTATVSVWSSQVAGQPQIDTAVASYKTIPTSNAGLKTCVNAPTDMCGDTTDPTSCLTTYGGLMLGDGDPVVIPAGGSVAIFVQDQLGDMADQGIVGITVRTESFP